MLSTKNYNNNSYIYANTGTFDKNSINGVITNDLLTTSNNTIPGNINSINLYIYTISGSLNNLTNLISINTISGDTNLNCTKIIYNG